MSLFAGYHLNKPQELVDLLDDLIKAALAIVTESKLTQASKPLKSLSLVLLFQMAEKGRSIHTLVSAGETAGVESIARSMFESHVDLQNLHNYPDDYPNYLLAAGTLNQCKQLDVLLRDSESPWAALLQRGLADISLETVREEKEGDLRQLKGVLPKKFFCDKEQRKLETKIEKKATWAGLRREYDSIYRYLSVVSHSDVVAATGNSQDHVSNWWPPERSGCSGTAILATVTYIAQALDRVTKKLRSSRHQVTQLNRRVAAWTQHRQEQSPAD